MGIALTKDHDELAKVVTAVMDKLGRPAPPSPSADPLPAWYSDAIQLGWLSLHVPESLGGSGYSLLETSIVVEALGRHLAGGPFLPTVATTAILLAVGTSNEPVMHAIPELSGGARWAGIGMNSHLTRSGETISGDAGLVLGAEYAGSLLLVVDDDLILVPADAPGLEVETPNSTDLTRPMSRVHLEGLLLTGAITLRDGRRAALPIWQTLLAAEASGVAKFSADDAVSYAKIRAQFGRPIGSFQAIKHQCSNMAAESEAAAALTWGAATAAAGDPDVFRLLAAGAVSTGAEVVTRNTQRALQIYAGIGFTWEHHAHLYMRRANALRQLCAPAASQRVTAELALAGTQLKTSLELPPEVELRRSEISQQIAAIGILPIADQRSALVEVRLAMPHWPDPWGLGASPGLQLLIEQEMQTHGVTRPDIGVSTPFLLLTVLQRGTPSQIARWVSPVLEGREVWCQLFSEPGAGSDAAAVRTSAVPVNGGWLINGQKVWSSWAHVSQWGMATVRTDTAAEKHDGLTMVVINMRSPGVDVRPLRQITGETGFNETFLTDVFVPDTDVIGSVGQGWEIARSTFGNERVTIGDGAGAGPPLTKILDAARYSDSSADLRTRLGKHVARDMAVRLLNIRRLMRSVAGTQSGDEGAITKLLGGLHGQEGAILETLLSADGGVWAAGQGGDAFNDLLSTQRLTIAGGTAEIVRNQIAERVLGLPREPRAGGSVR